jgi:hypothetical protein
VKLRHASIHDVSLDLLPEEQRKHLMLLEFGRSSLLASADEEYVARRALYLRKLELLKRLAPVSLRTKSFAHVESSAHLWTEESQCMVWSLAPNIYQEERPDTIMRVVKHARYASSRHIKALPHF